MSGTKGANHAEGTTRGLLQEEGREDTAAAEAPQKAEEGAPVSDHLACPSAFWAEEFAEPKHNPQRGSIARPA